MITQERGGSREDVSWAKPGSASPYLGQPENDRGQKEIHLNQGENGICNRDPMARFSLS